MAPTIVLELRFKALPAQTGVFELAVGVAGKVFTTTTVVPATLAQPELVAVTLYVPDAATVGFAMLGFCNVDVKPFGPVHEYVAPATVLELRFKAFPAQTGVFELATGVVGIALINTTVVPATLGQPELVAVTL